MRAALAALAALAAAGATAALATGGEAHWYTQIDNDVLYGTDRWYTSGVRIARVAPYDGHEWEWGLLQEIYTPEANRVNPIDRPPAGRLLATLARHDRAPGYWRTVELDLGVTGPAALGRQAQDLIHRIVPAPHEEWSHQRSNRADVQLVWVDSRRVLADPEHSPRLNAHYGVVLGNQLAFAHAGLEVRFGTGAASEMSSPVLRFAATPPPSLRGVATGWSVFLGASLRAVARNRLLDPNTEFADPVPDRHPVVQRFGGGFTWINRWSTLALALVHDSREFVGQRKPHGFGSLTIHIPF